MTLNLATIVNVLFGISSFYNTCIYVPQIYRLLKLKRSEELSLTMFIFFCVTQIIQIAYGYVIAHDYEYAIGMFFVFLACSFTTYLVGYYRIRGCGLRHFIGLMSKHRRGLIFCIMVAVVAGFVVWVLGRHQLELVLSVMFDLVFIVVGASFVFQIIGVLRSRHAKEFSVITFAGFNLIQIITALYAYYHHTTSLLVGMLVYLVTGGTLTMVILYFKLRNREF